MNKNSIHERVQHALTLHLDGRLGAEGKAMVREHLRRCQACSLSWSRLRRLDTVGRALPDAAAPSDLARRAREAARADRPTTTASPSWSRAVAAAALLFVGLGTGWMLGRWQSGGTPQETDPAPRIAEVADANADADSDAAKHAGPSEPKPSVTGTKPRRTRVDPLVPIEDDDEARRAARGVLADLAVIDTIPHNLRRPLLQAQLDHFGLSPWAAERAARPVAADPALNQAARLVRRLEEALTTSDGDDALLALHEEILDPELWAGLRAPPARAVASRAAPRAVWRRVAIETGRDLEPAQRDALGRALALKADWVKGADLAGMRRLVREVELTDSESDEVLRIAMATVLSDLGLPDAATPVLKLGTKRSPRAIGMIFGMTIGESGSLTPPGGADEGLAEILERHLRDLAPTADEREVLIEDGPDGKSHALKITIKRKIRIEEPTPPPPDR